MGQLYIPVKKEISGPWFIGIDALEELDKLFEFANKELSKSFDYDIEEEVKIKIGKGYSKDIETAKSEIENYNLNRLEKKVTIVSKDDKKLIDKSVNGILKDIKLKDFTPQELKLEIQYGFNYQFHFAISKRFDNLSFDAKSSNNNSLEDIQYEIEKWIDKYQPSKLKLYWNRLAFLIGFIGFLLLTSLLGIKSSESTHGEPSYKFGIDSLIKVGVNKDNQSTAIELLLKSSVKNTTEDDNIGTLPLQTIRRFFFIGLFLLFISILYPKTVIGIGKHKALLSFYNFYTGLILISIPSLLFLPILIDYIRGNFGI